MGVRFLFFLGTMIFAAAADGQSLTTLHTFNEADGRQATDTLIRGSDGRLYGTTMYGGLNGSGTVFAVNPDGSRFTTLHAFANSDGAAPFWGVIQGKDGRLYGVTLNGGQNQGGTVFAINTDGSGFSTLHFFQNANDGASPSSILQGSDGRIYGTFANGATSHGGIFAINTDGTGFTEIATFTTGSSASPQGVLQASNGRLYGTTDDDGLGYGTIFSLNTDGTGFTTLYRFTGQSDGSYPQALVQGADGRLYAGTYQGGTNNYGTIFAIGTDGTGFQTLWNFTGAAGGYSPFVGLSQGVDGRLYGVSFGGTPTGSLIFSLNPDGSNFAALYNFPGPLARGGLMTGADGGVYGTTQGSSDDEPVTYGTVYVLVLPPSITVQPQSQAVTGGAAATFSVTSSGSGLTYQWYFDRSPISGATAASYTLSSTEAANSGTYAVTVTNSLGSATSLSANLIVSPAAAPSISTQPANQAVTQGFPAQFSVGATGQVPLAYQWLKNGTPIPGATSSTYAIGVAQPSDAGSYSVSVSNAAGAATSTTVTLSVMPGYYFAVLAGAAGQAGSADGAGVEARFNQIEGIAVDAASNLYVTDSANDTVRKISPAGRVTTLAGAAGQTGSANGAGAQARFNYPTGIAADPAGDLFVADTNNSTIRKIAQDGTVTTFAGTAGQYGESDGSGSVAAFEKPEWLAQDSAGNLYAVDNLFHEPDNAYQGTTLRMVTPNGLVSTLTNPTPTVSASGIAVDAAGNLYFTEENSQGYGMLIEDSIGGTITTYSHIFEYIGSPSVAGANDFFITGSNVPNPVAEWTIQGGTPKSTNLPTVYLDPTSATGATAFAPIGSQAAIAIDPSGKLYLAYNDMILVGYPASAPQVVDQPLSQTAAAGASATFTISYAGGSVSEIQWYKDGLVLPGATTASYTIAAAQTSDEGSYSALLSYGSNGGTVLSLPGHLSVSAPLPPAIAVQPIGQTVNLGGNISFSVAASGLGPLTYQWFFNGSPIAGGTGATLAFQSIQLGNAGTYTVAVSNSSGTATSNQAVLFVTNPANGPVLVAQPVSQSISSGATVVFSVAAQPSPTTSYQWYQNGVTIAGATDSKLMIRTASATNAGQYNCVVSDSTGSSSSATAMLAISTLAGTPRIVNMSVLGRLQSSLTLGFVLGGASTSVPESMLVRGVGPALANFGVPGFLPDPEFSIVQQSNGYVLASNSGWGTPLVNIAPVGAADAAAGAFPLADPTSLDAASVMPLPVSAGGYTVQVKGKSGDSGIVLAEIYDASVGGATASSIRLVNLSCLNYVPSGGALTAGFVIDGPSAETVLIRAIGPSLSGYGTPSPLPDPEVTLQPLGSNTLVASNTRWAGDTQIAAAATAIGAFALPDPSSGDSAVLVTLAPGAYTAQITSAGGGAGNALVEVYEVP